MIARITRKQQNKNGDIRSLAFFADVKHKVVKTHECEVHIDIRLQCQQLWSDFYKSPCLFISSPEPKAHR